MEDIELKVKIYLEQGGEKFMGIGVLWLLERIEQKGSILAASRDMGISYSKAFSMVSNLEKVLGKEVIDRKRGGQGREGSSLTEYGKRFIELYDNFQKECKNLLKEPYKVFKNNMNELCKNCQN